MSDPYDIAAWRARMGLSQRAAAQALGVALTTYQQWERGTSRRTGQPVEVPRVVVLACEALERDARQL